MANIPYTRTHADQHTADLISWYLGLSEDTVARVTDLNAGSNLRDIFEAVAIKLESLDNAVFVGLRAAIPAILYEWFGIGNGITSFVGFPALPALPASGDVWFFLDPSEPLPYTIPVGTRLSQVAGPPSVVYSTQDPVTVISGSFAIARVVASAPGPVGTVAGGQLYLLDTNPHLLSASNPFALQGIAAETEEDRRQRFALYVRNLARSQNEALEAGAMTAQVISGGLIVEHVLEAHSFEPPGTRGLVTLWIDNGNGSASPELVTNTQRIIDGYVDEVGARVIGYKAAGIVVSVKAVVPTAVAITVAITIDNAYTFTAVQQAVQSAILTHLIGLGIGDDLIVTELAAAIATVPGVIDHQLSAPTTNVSADDGGRLLAGIITVTST